MSLTTAIYLVAAFMAGGGLAYFLTRIKKNHENKENILDPTVNVRELQEKSDIVQRQVAEETASDSPQEISTLQQKYETLLHEANLQIENLDKQLKNALEGKLDASAKAQLADAEKLNKRIKELEEELEENADDLSDLKKKLKKKDEQCTEAQDALAKEQKSNTQLQTELTSVRESLRDKTEELNLKMGSLDFIQEILSAPPVGDADMTKLDNYIAKVEAFTTDQLINCMATLQEKGYISFVDGFEAAKEEWKRRFLEWASVEKKNWVAGKTTIAFVGEFSAGKTSIVNRILSQDKPNVPRLPVSTKATTAVATYIAGGPAETYRFVTPDDQQKSITRQTFTEKVSKEVLDQIKGVSSLIKYFVMTYKNPNLDGLSILDTPGFTSNDRQDSERTMEVINECDALFWVFDINAGTINRSSIKVIKQHLNKPLYVVINKVDTKSTAEIQQVESLIKKTLKNEGLTVERFIRFSAKAPLSDIMEPIKEVKHSGNQENFFNNLGDEIDNILRILEEQRKEYNDNYQNTIKEGDKLNDEFVKQLNSLQDYCNKAENIPHFETHLFRKDNYEMSQQEYGRLQHYLQLSVDLVGSMATSYDEKTENATNFQQAFAALSDIESAWRSVNEMKSQLKRIQKTNKR